MHKHVFSFLVYLTKMGSPPINIRFTACCSALASQRFSHNIHYATIYCGSYWFHLKGVFCQSFVNNFLYIDFATMSLGMTVCYERILTLCSSNISMPPTFTVSFRASLRAERFWAETSKTGKPIKPLYRYGIQAGAYHRRKSLCPVQTRHSQSFGFTDGRPRFKHLFIDCRIRLGLE